MIRGARSDTASNIAPDPRLFAPFIDSLITAATLGVAYEWGSHLNRIRTLTIAAFIMLPGVALVAATTLKISKNVAIQASGDVVCAKREA